MSNLDIITVDDQLVIDSRLIADELGIKQEEWESLVLFSLDTVPLYFTVWQLLAIARCASLKDEAKISSSLLIITRKYFESRLSGPDKGAMKWMALAVMEGYSLDLLSRSSEIGGVHPWFKDNHERLIPGSELIKVKSKDKKRPDFLVKVNEIVSPVECKIDFGPHGLKQLKSYMRLWESPVGYAVAKTFTVNLPNNIVGIKVSNPS